MRIALYLNILDEEYQISFYRGIRMGAEELGMDLVCIQDETLNRARRNGQRPFPLPRYLSVDGILLLTSVIIEQDDPSFPESMKKIFPGIPLVSIGNRIAGIPSILIHGGDSMRKLMEHLISYHGYRKFLYLGGPARHRDNIEREAAFREAVSARPGMPALEGTVMSLRFSEEFAERTVRNLIAPSDAGRRFTRERAVAERKKSPPDAIVAASDNMAIGVLKALRSSGDEKWQSCAVTGFDDIPQAALEEPALTTVHQPLDMAGKIAMQTIRDIIEGRAVPETVTIDSELVIRSSCGCADREQEDRYATLRGRLVRLQRQRSRGEQLLRYVSIFGQRIATASSMQEIIPHLRGFLAEIGARAFFLILFPEGTTTVPDSGTLAYRYTADGDLISGEVNSAMPLEEFFSLAINSGRQQPVSRSVYQLAAGAEIPGLIVYEVDDDVLPHMCSSAVFIANTIKRLRALDTEKEHSRRLAEKVELRTKDLSETNRKLADEAERRKEVEAEILRIGELERLRFSLDLHDDICQRLAGISMFCKSLELGPKTGNEAEIADLSQMIDETLMRTRQYAHESFPVELDSLGLKEALESLCHTTTMQTGCVCLFSWTAPAVSPLGRARDINIYRIAQEAIANAVRHSRASRVDVSVSAGNVEKTEGAKTLDVRIQDNGKGNPDLEIEQNTLPSNGDRRSGLGLRSMRYRARQIGASYRIHSSADTGTLIEIRVPW